MKRLTHLIILAAALLAGSVPMHAQGTVYIEDFSIDPGSTVEVAIRAHLDADAFTGLNGDIVMPVDDYGTPLLTLVPYPDGCYFRTDNSSPLALASSHPERNSYRLLAWNLSAPIPGDGSPVAYMQVRATDNFIGQETLLLPASGRHRWNTTRHCAAVYPATRPCRVNSTRTAIDVTLADPVVASVIYYSTTGVASTTPHPGVNIVVTSLANGTVSARKVIINPDRKQ